MPFGFRSSLEKVGGKSMGLSSLSIESRCVLLRALLSRRSRSLTLIVSGSRPAFESGVEDVEEPLFVELPWLAPRHQSVFAMDVTREGAGAAADEPAAGAGPPSKAMTRSSPLAIGSAYVRRRLSRNREPSESQALGLQGVWHGGVLTTFGMFLYYSQSSSRPWLPFVSRVSLQCHMREGR